MNRSTMGSSKVSMRFNRLSISSSAKSATFWSISARSPVFSPTLTISRVRFENSPVRSRLLEKAFPSRTRSATGMTALPTCRLLIEPAEMSMAWTRGMPPESSVPSARVNCDVAKRWNMGPRNGSFSRK